ncbi:hypothetical protein PLICRDRAFT_180388 [Plicaturopsis crispa FD-325 SS-3]|uniref:Uncharacterized protein n=1 Tax=Plicaturopsis crispa FD-325 SS-3 TaxID=944288 RepID=A0A0C9T2I6_PLICR|nr:hypothetical protein PLICRDRAFT_180388 [Plicaturopsis crispa FD-325 SS-3]
MSPRATRSRRKIEQPPIAGDGGARVTRGAVAKQPKDPVPPSPPAIRKARPKRSKTTAAPSAPGGLAEPPVQLMPPTDPAASVQPATAASAARPQIIPPVNPATSGQHTRDTDGTPTACPCRISETVVAVAMQFTRANQRRHARTRTLAQQRASSMAPPKTGGLEGGEDGQGAESVHQPEQPFEVLITSKPPKPTRGMTGHGQAEYDSISGTGPSRKPLAGVPPATTRPAPRPRTSPWSNDDDPDATFKLSGRRRVDNHRTTIAQSTNDNGADQRRGIDFVAEHQQQGVAGGGTASSDGEMGDTDQGGGGDGEEPFDPALLLSPSPRSHRIISVRDAKGIKRPFDLDERSNVGHGAKREAKKKCEAKQKKGDDVSDTDADDLEEEEEFIAETEGVVGPKKAFGGKTKTATKRRRGKKQPIASPPSAANSPPRIPQHKKGKGRAVDAEEESDDDDETEDWEKIPGPFPKAAMDEADELSQLINERATAIAKKYGKHKSDVLVHAGVGLKQTRSANRWNKYGTWYAHTHPKSKDITAEEYAQEIHAAYKKLMHGKNTAARREAARPMIEFCEQLERGNIDGGMTCKAASSMMIAAHAQFTDLCRHYAMHDVVIAGVIASSGSDAAARQLAEVFGTNTSLVEFLDANAVNVRIFLDWFTNCLLSHKYSAQGVNLPLPSGMKIDAESNKVENRDAQRKGVTDMMNRKLHEHEPKATMQWKHWADLAFAKKLCIIGWPKNVTAPGPEWKKIASAAATALTAGYHANRRNPNGERVPEVQIVRWDADDIARNTEDNELANVPVVVDTDGQVLRTVMDSKAYRTSLGAERDARSNRKPIPATMKLSKRKDTARDEGEDFTDVMNNVPEDSNTEAAPSRQRATRPLPSRAQQPERTLKRKRLDKDAADIGEHATKRSHTSIVQTNMVPTSHLQVSQPGPSTNRPFRGVPAPSSRNSAQGGGPAMIHRRPAVEGPRRQPSVPRVDDDDDLPGGPAAMGFFNPQTGRYYQPRPAAPVRSSDLLVAGRQGRDSQQNPAESKPSTQNLLPFFATAPAPKAPTAAIEKSKATTKPVPLRNSMTGVTAGWATGIAQGTDRVVRTSPVMLGSSPLQSPP